MDCSFNEILSRAIRRGWIESSKGRYKRTFKGKHRVDYLSEHID